MGTRPGSMPLHSQSKSYALVIAHRKNMTEIPPVAAAIIEFMAA